MNDFYDWKHNSITEAVFAELRGRMQVLTEWVVENAATLSAPEIAEKTGAIKAIRDILNIEFQDISQETE